MWKIRYWQNQAQKEISTPTKTDAEKILEWIDTAEFAKLIEVKYVDRQPAGIA